MKNPSCSCGDITDIFKLIDSVSKKTKKLHRETIKSTLLTPSQYSILNLLWEKDERPFKELSSLYGSSRAAMTGIVDGLEKNGLITRENHPTDRRSLLVKLTEEGEKLQNKVPGLDEALSHCCNSLKPEEFAHLGRILNKLDQSLSRSLGEIN